MSRVGKLPISVPNGVTVSIGDGSVGVKGSLGESQIAIPEALTVEQADNQVVVKRSGDGRKERSLHGLVRVLIANAVTGVSEGFSRVLEISGVGFRAELKGDTILFNLGFSHPILFQCSSLSAAGPWIRYPLAKAAQGGEGKAELRLLFPSARRVGESGGYGRVHGLGHLVFETKNWWGAKQAQKGDKLHLCAGQAGL